MILDTKWLVMLRAQMIHELGKGKRMWSEPEIQAALDRAIAWALIGYIRP